MYLFLSVCVYVSIWAYVYADVYMWRWEEDTMSPLSFSSCVCLWGRGSPCTWSLCFLTELETKQASEVLSQLLRSGATGMHRTSSLLCRYWGPNSGPHDCAASPLQPPRFYVLIFNLFILANKTLRAYNSVCIPSKFQGPLVCQAVCSDTCRYKNTGVLLWQNSCSPLWVYGSMAQRINSTEGRFW